MGQKTVVFSDLSGQIITGDDALARIVVQEHPGLGDGPVEIEALTDEARALEKAALRVAVADLYLPGESEPLRVALEADSFDKLATDRAMGEVLSSARPARRTPKSAAVSPARGDRTDYGTLGNAGKPHKGRVTDAEKRLVRERFDEMRTGSWPRGRAQSAWSTASMSRGTAWRSWPGRGASSRASTRADAHSAAGAMTASVVPAARPAASLSYAPGPPLPGWTAVTAPAIAVSDRWTSRASCRLRSGPARNLRSGVLR